MIDRDDMTLLKAIAEERDCDAFQYLYERYQQRAFNVSFRLLRNSVQAQDAVQDAMLSIWKAPASALPRGDPEAWIMRIIMNKSLDMRRNQRRNTTMKNRIASENNKMTPKPVPEGENKEQISILRKLIDQLPDPERTMLLCNYCSNMSHREIAKVVGVSQPTVSSKIQHALERLRTSLTQMGVASVGPLMTQSGLFKAMTSGHECPPGMAAMSLEHINSRATDSRALPQQAQAAAASHGMWVAGAASLAAVAVVSSVLYFSKTTEVTTPQINTTQEKQPETKVEVSRPATATVSPKYEQRWTFEKGAPADIELKEGEWHWDREGCMVANKEAFLLLPALPEEALSKPMMLQIKVRDVPNPNGPKYKGCGFDWSDGVRILPHDLYRIPDKGNAPFSKKTPITTYLVGHRTLSFENQKCVGATEYKTLPPDRRLSLMMVGVMLFEITLKTVEPSELPKELEDPKALISKLPEHSVQNEFVFISPKPQSKDSPKK